MNARVDPGYGSAIAPKGTEEWAKNWRLVFQGIAKELPEQPQRAIRYYKVGLEYRAWTLLTDATGKHFADFDAFCVCPQPFGLGIDPAKFRAHLEAEEGKRAVELMTVGPGVDVGGRPKKGETGDTMSPVSEAIDKKAKRIRAITRAPEIVQDLYRQGKINQTTAAKLGPKKPTPEQAAKVAEARQEIERLDLNKPAREVRKAVDRAVNETLGKAIPTALDAVKKAFSKLSEEDQQAFREWADKEAGCLF